MKRLVRCPLTAVTRLAAIGLCLLLAARSPAADWIPRAPLADPASASPGLRYLPKNYWAVVEVNWGAIIQLVDSPEARQNPQYAQFEQSLEMIQAATGIDAAKDVERITSFATFDHEPPVGGAVVIQGTFDIADVESRLRLWMASGAVVDSHRRHIVYQQNDVSFCFPSPGVLLVGDDRTVRQSLDRLDTKMAPLPAALRNVLDRTPAESVVWVAVRPPAILARQEMAEWRSEYPAISENLAQIECASLSIAMDADGLRFEALGYVPDPDDAEAVSVYLSERKWDLLHRSGANVMLASILVLSEVQQAGSYVGGSTALTLNGLEELWSTKFIKRP